MKYSLVRSDPDFGLFLAISNILGSATELYIYCIIYSLNKDCLEHCSIVCTGSNIVNTQSNCTDGLGFYHDVGRVVGLPQASPWTPGGPLSDGITCGFQEKRPCCGR